MKAYEQVSTSCFQVFEPSVDARIATHHMASLHKLKQLYFNVGMELETETLKFFILPFKVLTSTTSKDPKNPQVAQNIIMFRNDM